MTVEQAEPRLRQLLAENDFEPATPDPVLGWRVFQRFVREPVENAEDGILFEIGVYSFTGVEQCHLGFVRQFSIYGEGGEYDHMEQLHLLFLCDPTERLRQFETNRWAFNFPSLDAFFAEVEGMTAFQEAVTPHGQTWRCTIEQFEV